MVDGQNSPQGIGVRGLDQINRSSYVISFRDVGGESPRFNSAENGLSRDVVASMNRADRFQTEMLNPWSAGLLFIHSYHYKRYDDCLHGSISCRRDSC